MESFIALLLAIITVESNGDQFAVGDDGAAFGALQIHAAYAQDAAEFVGENWEHSDAFDRDIAERMFTAYMARYATESRLGRFPTAEDVARIHNGGLNGFRRSSTDAYWLKVKKVLEERGHHDVADGKVSFIFSR